MHRTNLFSRFPASNQSLSQTQLPVEKRNNVAKSYSPSEKNAITSLEIGIPSCKIFVSKLTLYKYVSLKSSLSNQVDMQTS